MCIGQKPKPQSLKTIPKATRQRERERELFLSVCLGVRGFLIKAAESLSIPLLQRTSSSSSSSSVALFLCLSLQPGLALSLSSSVTLSLCLFCALFLNFGMWGLVYTWLFGKKILELLDLGWLVSR